MMQGCRDMGVILGRVDRSACAGHPRPRCEVTGAPLDDEEEPFQTDEMKTLFIYDARTGQMVGRHVVARPQSQYENCTMHNDNSDRGRR